MNWPHGHTWVMVDKGPGLQKATHGIISLGDVVLTSKSIIIVTIKNLIALLFTDYGHMVRRFDCKKSLLTISILDGVCIT